MRKLTMIISRARRHSLNNNNLDGVKVVLQKSVGNFITKALEYALLF